MGAGEHWMVLPYLSFVGLFVICLEFVLLQATIKIFRGRRSKSSYVTSRVPKGFRAPGLQDGKFGARGLHCFIPGLHLAKNSIFVCAPSTVERGFGLRAPRQKFKNFRAPGLQRSPPSPFGTLDKPITVVRGGEQY